MTTANIKPQLFDIVGKAKSNQKAHSVNSSGSKFADIMDDNMKLKDVEDKSTDSKQVNVDMGKKTESTHQEVIKDSDLKNTETLDELNSQKTITESLESITSTKEEEFVAALKNTLMEQLGLTEEELEKAMEALGFTMSDLLNTDNLKQLVLQVNETDDISEFLTNEELVNTLNELTKAVKSTVEEFGITKEQIEAYLVRINSQNVPGELNAENPEVKLFEDKEEAENNNVKTVGIKEDEIKIEVIKTEAETKNFTSDNSRNGSDNENKLLTSFETFIQNLAANGVENVSSFSEEAAVIRQMQDITSQIVEQIKVLINPDQTSMELQLNPEHLGKINLSVVAKDGVLTAQFTTQNEITKEAIESQLHILKENLNNQGLKVEAIEVTVSNFDFAQSDQAAGDTANQQNQSDSRRSFFDSQDTTEDENAETSSVDILEEGLSSVDYIA